MRIIGSGFGKLLIGAVAGVLPLGTAMGKDTVTRERGSGKPYKTVVKREQQGEITESDLRQASLLSSQLVLHTNEAVKRLRAEEVDKAKQEIRKGRKLVGFIRELLPVTKVTTIVKKQDGKQVYKDVRKVRQDEIRIYENSAALGIVDPLSDAKKKDKEKKPKQGVQVAGAQLVQTAMLADVSYIDRQLRRAKTHLKQDKVEKAVEALTQAKVRGVQFHVDRKNHPLVQAEAALRLAERMAKLDRTTAVRANLRRARSSLGLYASGLDDRERIKKVRTAEQTLKQLLSKEDVTSEKAVKQIRSLWQRFRQWLQPKQGEARKTKKSQEL